MFSACMYVSEHVELVCHNIQCFPIPATEQHTVLKMLRSAEDAQLEDVSGPCVRHMSFVQARHTYVHTYIHVHILRIFSYTPMYAHDVQCVLRIILKLMDSLSVYLFTKSSFSSYTIVAKHS